MTEEKQVRPPRRSLLQQWDNLPFLGIHLMCLGALITGVTWEWVLLAVISYYVRMIGVTAGYHRYFSHRSYKTGRLFQFFLACLAMTSAQKGVLWWAAHHRHHHRHSDRQRDLHSPAQQGFWYSHVGWILSDSSTATQFHLVKDLARYPELMWLNRFYVVPPLLYACLMYGLWGMPGLIWGFFISTTALYHGTFFINSLSHVIGRVRYDSGDDSRNSWILAILCCGEGWHNNHHHYQLAVNQGWFWWEVDLSYYIVRALSWTGVVWDLRMPPESVKRQTIAATGLRHRLATGGSSSCSIPEGERTFL